MEGTCPDTAVRFRDSPGYPRADGLDAAHQMRQRFAAAERHQNMHMIRHQDPGMEMVIAPQPAPAEFPCHRGAHRPAREPWLPRERCRGDETDLPRYRTTTAAQGCVTRGTGPAGLIHAPQHPEACRPGISAHTLASCRQQPRSGLPALLPDPRKPTRAFRPSYLTCANPLGPSGPPTRPAQIRPGLPALLPDPRKPARAFRPS